VACPKGRSETPHYAGRIAVIAGPHHGRTQGREGRALILDEREKELALFWVRQSPVLAREFVAGLLNDLQGGRDLNPAQREYLVGAFRRILEGDTADKALALTRPRGRHDETFTPRNIEIYNLVQSLIAGGESPEDARIEAGLRFLLSEKAVETICDKLKAAIEEK
jgi:hypothetical protein